MERVTRTAQSARASYNALSQWYDLMAGASERPFREAGLALLEVAPGERVLELGYGTGHALVALARSVGDAGRVVGVDISDGMARIASRRVAESGNGARVSLCLADGARHCFAPGSFDAVFMSFTLELFDTPDIPSVLVQCREMLSDQGRIGVVALVKPAGVESLPVKLYESAHRVLPRWVDCRPIFLRRCLAESSFSIVAADRRSMWGLPVDIVVARPAP